MLRVLVILVLLLDATSARAAAGPPATGAPPATVAPASAAPAAAPPPASGAATPASTPPVGDQALAVPDPAPVLAPGEIPLTPRDAARQALQANLELLQERLDPALTDGAERSAAAAFIPELFGSTNVTGSPGRISAERAGLSPTSTTNVQGKAGVRKALVYGTELEASLSSSALFGGGGRGGLDPAYEGGLNLTVRQPLLQGRSRLVNEAAVVRARLTREMAQANLTRRAELLAATAFASYWELRAALAKVKIQAMAVQTAEQTLRETEALIAAGKLAASERAAAAYAVRQAQRLLGQREQELENVRDRLARLIGLVPPDSAATPRLVPVSRPRRTPPRQWSLAELQRTATENRSDFKVLLLALEQETLQAQVARHQLLPRLDLSAGLGLTGLSGEAADESTTTDYREGYWSSYLMDQLGWSAGVTLEVPLDRDAARVQVELAGLRVKQAEAARQVAVQELTLELNLAWRAMETAREQLRLTEEAVALATTKLESETAHYQAGKTTAHILATVQTEVAAEQLGREQAVADLARAMVELQAAAGILLTRLKLRPDGTVIP